jgi:DNA modification methylase
MTRWHILAGDCLASLQLMPEQSVQCCITSPPYWGLRDYGHDGQIGLEETPDAYVAQMVEVFREVRRVLKDDGTLWLNLGDSYSGAANSGGANQNSGGPAVRASGLPVKGGHNIKPKDLVGIPWRVAFALQADGWWLRQDIIWHKPNPMPESVTDRCTKAHEYVFLLTKSARYYYDAEAVCEPATNKSCGNIQSTKGARTGDVKHRTKGNLHMVGAAEHRNRRSVWLIVTQPYSGAHFAVMPEALVEPCLLAGSRPGDVVLDPFTGSGTVGAVAIGHGRSFIGCELNPAYIDLARQRIGSVAPMFSAEAQPWGAA